MRSLFYCQDLGIFENEKMGVKDDVFLWTKESLKLGGPKNACWCIRLASQQSTKLQQNLRAFKKTKECLLCDKDLLRWVELNNIEHLLNYYMYLGKVSLIGNH